MNFKYHLTREDEKRIIYQKNAKTNLIYITLISILFLIITMPLLLDNTLLIFVLYIIYIAIMLLALFLVNKIMTNVMVKMNEKALGQNYGVWEVKCTKQAITEKIEDREFKINLDEITKLKISKQEIDIYAKGKEFYLTFNRNRFENIDDFDKLKEWLNKNVKQTTSSKNKK